MALNRKYANLPDLDSAPDIYETPDLTDDISTVPTTGPSHSDDELDLDDETGISRSRLRIDEARSRFLPSNVDATAADFSDRVDGKRKSYRTSTRRQRILQDGTEELGDFSDDEAGESLDRKIARLQREIAEAREEYDKKKAAAGTADSQDDKLASLSEALEEISGGIEPRTGGIRLPATTTRASNEEQDVEQVGGEIASGKATYTITYAPTFEESHALAKAADFDRRLLLLEKAIGISSAALPEVDVNGLPRAILPTLDTLQRQIVTLSQASTTNLDTLTRRVRTLTQEAHQLEKARQGAKEARDALSPQGATDGENGDTEEDAKINALYGTLPTIENLAPLLPPLLDRLRSLRDIHSEAATASETLERLEKEQADMAGEMKQWRDGLEKVEEAIKEGDAAMSGNAKIIEQWVKDLEARMDKLA
ncbi:Dynamitin-domain-containing protein [Plectosphaerella plurivora]|uniref:Dynamitin-domain-containing protein n=1 Tax=Plectosphaerella plurivora TaxID=936078 RepID=A0A9P8VHK0_9PEZI|nr:Dynamitin-domain-containing protein [Plectosphaerella plurivora]